MEPAYGPGKITREVFNTALVMLSELPALRHLCLHDDEGTFLEESFLLPRAFMTGFASLEHLALPSIVNGNGMVLGVDDAYQYEEYSREGWNPDDIILIGTDGIHETRNESDQMFGQQRLQEIIQQHGAASAKNINNCVINSVREFRGKASQEDDVTLVVIKLL